MNKYELIYDMKEHLEVCPNEDYYLSYNQVEMVVNYFKELQQENQQLKEQLQRKYDNFPKTVKNLSKEQLESLYLDLLHIENEKHKQLQQRDEVINEARNYIFNHELVKTPHKYVIDGNTLLNILNKGRESHD